MAHLVGRLTAVKVAKVKKPGMYADDAGLYLQVTDPGFSASPFAVAPAKWVLAPSLSLAWAKRGRRQPSIDGRSDPGCAGE
nr:hypothetical protein [Bradyrhizobium aeschynomenes]